MHTTVYLHPNASNWIRQFRINKTGYKTQKHWKSKSVFSSVKAYLLIYLFVDAFTK